VGSIDGGITVQNNLKSSRVIDVKAKQDDDLTFVELNEVVLEISKERECVLRYQNR